MCADTVDRVRDQAARDGFHAQILDNVADGVCFVDTERTITYWNRGAEHLTGYAAADVVGRSCFDDLLGHVDGGGTRLCDGACPLAASIADGEERETQVWLRHRDGARKPVRVRTAPIRDDGGRVIGGVEILSDATSLVSASEQAGTARRDALLDELTGLPNRRFLNMMLTARLEDLERHGTSLAVLVIDVDHFKRVNDRLGHPAGDELLKVIASTIAGGVRAGDFAARWGGEQFVVLANQASPATALDVAERLRALVATVSPALTTTARNCTVSIGMALARRGDDVFGLLERADHALSAAKEAGRNRVRLDR